MDEFAVVKRQVTSAISMSHGLSVADLVLVPLGSIPITTSGKVRRSAWVSSTGKVSSPVERVGIT
jgi:long-chain fatty acid adenylyltransferase FadD28